LIKNVSQLVTLQIHIRIELVGYTNDCPVRQTFTDPQRDKKGMRFKPNLRKLI